MWCPHGQPPQRRRAKCPAQRRLRREGRHGMPAMRARRCCRRRRSSARDAVASAPRRCRPQASSGARSAASLAPVSCRRNRRSPRRRRRDAQACRGEPASPSACPRQGFGSPRRCGGRWRRRSPAPAAAHIGRWLGRQSSGRRAGRLGRPVGGDRGSGASARLRVPRRARAGGRPAPGMLMRRLPGGLAGGRPAHRAADRRRHARGRRAVTAHRMKVP